MPGPVVYSAAAREPRAILARDDRARAGGSPARPCMASRSSARGAAGGAGGRGLGSRTRMRCNWWRWLWGIIPLLVLSWVAIEAEHARLENDLTERGKAALSAKGFDWAIAEFKGRDAVLSGRAPQEGEPAKAAAALAETWGVRIVDNRAGLLDKAEKYIWIASRRNNPIRLSGFAPSISARQAILGVTKATFPGYEVVDRTTLARGVPSTDVWRSRCTSRPCRAG